MGRADPRPARARRRCRGSAHKRPDAIAEAHGAQGAGAVGPSWAFSARRMRARSRGCHHHGRLPRDPPALAEVAEQEVDTVVGSPEVVAEVVRHGVGVPFDGRRRHAPTIGPDDGEIAASLGVGKDRRALQLPAIWFREEPPEIDAFGQRGVLQRGDEAPDPRARAAGKAAGGMRAIRPSMVSGQPGRCRRGRSSASRPCGRGRPPRG
jgi:hypothetical protein